MSIEHVARVLNGAHDLPPGAKLVLLGIANHDGDGGAWPAVATLARYANMSARAVQQHLAKLEAMGYLARVMGGGGMRDTRADRRPTLYRIDYARVVDKSRSRGEAQCTPIHARGEADDIDGVKPTTPEPSLNHPYTNTLTDSVPEHVELVCLCFPRRKGGQPCPVHTKVGA